MSQEETSVSFLAPVSIHEDPELFVTAYRSASASIEQTLQKELEETSNSYLTILKSGDYKDYRYLYLILARYFLLAISIDKAELYSLDIKFLAEICKQQLEEAPVPQLKPSQKIHRFYLKYRYYFLAVIVAALAFLVVNFFM
jgi:hypothetical protein